jgi:hypothetical protein
MTVPARAALNTMPNDASRDLARAERQVLARERAVKSGAAGCGTRTTYIYATGPDGKRYVVGAEVSVTGTEEALDSIPGGRRTGMSAGVKISGGGPDDEPISKNPETRAGSAKSSAKSSANDRAVAELEEIQNDVIAHEAAHKAAAGRFGGPVSYTYTTGPDGKRYITGGEVPISTPPTKDPEEALRNASIVARAALAPGDPSGQDIAVAASAAQMAASARSMIAEGAGKPGKPEKSSDGAGNASQKAIDTYSRRLSPKGLWLQRDATNLDRTAITGYGFEIAT